MAPEPKNSLRYRADVTYMVIETATGEVVGLPVYMLLLSEDLLKSLPTIQLRYGEQLKLETIHGTRKFRVWYSDISGSGRIRIEEWRDEEWKIVHSFRSL